jgi:hypothetical protein
VAFLFAKLGRPEEAPRFAEYAVVLSASRRLSSSVVKGFTMMPVHHSRSSSSEIDSP